MPSFVSLRAAALLVLLCATLAVAPPVDGGVLQPSTMPSMAAFSPALSLVLQALRPSAASAAGHGGRPGVDIGDFTSRPKINLGFEPTALQKELMAAGAVHDGGGQFPASLYNDWFPNYYMCEACAHKKLAGALQDDRCYVCPVIFCVPCHKLYNDANIVKTPPYEYCAQTTKNPHFPKSCANSPSPVSSLFRCVDSTGKALAGDNCNPLYQMIGNTWASGGVNMPYLAMLIRSFTKLFAPSMRPALEPDYFDPKAAYAGALREPFQPTPGSTPNSLAPPL